MQIFKGLSGEGVQMKPEQEAGSGDEEMVGSLCCLSREGLVGFSLET
jgi:hypothetical protein